VPAQAVRRLQASFSAYRKEATRLADDFAGTLADTLLQAAPPDNGAAGRGRCHGPAQDDGADCKRGRLGAVDATVIIHHRGAGELAEATVSALAAALQARLGLVDPAGANGAGKGKRGKAPTPEPARVPAPSAAPVLAVLLWGDVGAAGGFVLVGEPAWLEVAGPAVAAALDGRGGQGRGALRFQYQGKAKRLLALDELRHAVPPRPTATSNP